MGHALLFLLMPVVSEPAFQTSLWAPGPSRSGAVEQAIRRLALAPPSERGAVHTKPEVARFVLDLAGYRADRPLHTVRVLEPSFGDGVFLKEITRRLLASWNREGRPGGVDGLRSAVRAVEIHRDTFDTVRAHLWGCLTVEGIDGPVAESLLAEWLRCDDFLLVPFEDGFEVVVGNPPYVRQEAIPDALIARYRKDYATIYDRADLYVPFIERGLRLLKPGGRLTYICADRWMKNRYGGPLRGLVAQSFHLDHMVGMHGADAFEGEVDAYPSVFTLSRPEDSAKPATTTYAADPRIDDASLARLARQLDGEDEDGPVRHVAGVLSGDEPWVFEASDAVALLRRLERTYPTLEGAGGKAGIGVATGADRVFIASPDDLPIEPDRILPLAMAKDVRPDGTVEWSGRALANPFADDGSLVDLAEYPRLREYFEGHRDALRRRHVAKKTPARWYRTIDKVHAALTSRPKLLIPDIKGGAVVAYDGGQLYPHHNLYVVTSDTWDLRALQAVLRSRLAEFQVAAYAVRMRGGYIRFQAQYLRRIRVPQWETVPAALRDRLSAAAQSTRERCDEVVFELYGLSDDEAETVRHETESGR